MKSACYFCQIKTIQNLIKKFNPNTKDADILVEATHQCLSQNWDKKIPEISGHVHGLVKNHLKVGDLYREEKENANQLMASNIEHWRRFISESKDPFNTALKMAVAGNIIDYGAHVVEDDVRKQVDEILHLPLEIDDSLKLKQVLEKAGSVLYLGDNAGEIYFDKLLIETINHPNLTFVTRGAPVINDITLEDAYHVGINEICNVIDNGHDAPSTIVHACSDEFKDAYEKADVVISKGQGNFEGLMDEENKNIFFLFVAKCKVIADVVGCSKFDKVVYSKL